jgi:hypothetical protein
MKIPFLKSSFLLSCMQSYANKGVVMSSAEVRSASQVPANHQVGEKEKCLISLMKQVSTLSSIALFIIGCVGAAGRLPASTTGWCAIGLGGTTFVLQSASDLLKNREITWQSFNAFAVASIVCGVLGVTGTLSGTAVGWGVLAVPLVGIGVSCVVGGFLGYKFSQIVINKL